MEILIEEYAEKPRIGFYMPAIPWKWTIYDGSKIKSYGYAHTREQAEVIANKHL